MESTFRAGGLATGLDTNTIVDKLSALEARPLEKLRARRLGFETQISLLGDLASKLKSLTDASSSLATGGLLATKVASTNTTFSAVPGTGAVAGRYSVEVQNLAKVAKAMSQAYADPTSTVRRGTLTIGVNGTDYLVTVGNNTTLEQLATSISNSGAPVAASVLTDATGSYLSITRTETGYTGNDPVAALKLSFQATGGANNGASPTFTSTQQAENALLTVDGLSFTRTTNSFSDVIPNVTMSLTKVGAEEELVIASDSDATATRLDNFVKSFNALAAAVQRQLSPEAKSDRSRNISGDSSVRSLQARLRGWVATELPDGTLRSLTDLGIKTNRDGTLSLDKTTLAKAVATNPASIDRIFSDATNGLGAVGKTLVDDFTSSSDGIFTSRQSGLRLSIDSTDTSIRRMELRLEKFRENLISRFAAMEQVVSGLKSTGAYLSQQQFGGK